MAKKRIYEVYVDGPGCDGTYSVVATSVAEAKKMAKEKFIKEWWRKSDLRCVIERSEAI